MTNRCPVCDREHETMICPDCGFDHSAHYEARPTLAPIPEHTKAVSALLKKSAAPEPQTRPESTYEGEIEDGKPTASGS